MLLAFAPSSRNGIRVFFGLQAGLRRRTVYTSPKDVQSAQDRQSNDLPEIPFDPPDCDYDKARRAGSRGSGIVSRSRCGRSGNVWHIFGLFKAQKSKVRQRWLLVAPLSLEQISSSGLTSSGIPLPSEMLVSREMLSPPSPQDPTEAITGSTGSTGNQCAHSFRRNGLKR
eukprot:s1680_g9.t1